MRILDGDGHTLVPGFVIRLSARVAAHTMVIVDGEKHMHTRAHTRAHMHIDIQVIVDGEKRSLPHLILPYLTLPYHIIPYLTLPLLTLPYTYR